MIKFKWNAQTQTLLGTIVSLIGVCAVAWFSAKETDEMTADDKITMESGTVVEKAKTAVVTHPKTAVAMAVTCTSIILTERLSWKAIGELGAAVAVLSSQNEKLTEIISEVRKTPEGEKAVEEAGKRLAEPKARSWDKLKMDEPINLWYPYAGVMISNTSRGRVESTKVYSNLRLGCAEVGVPSPIVTVADYLRDCGATEHELASALHPERLAHGWTNDSHSLAYWSYIFAGCEYVVILDTYPWDDDAGCWSLVHLIEPADLDAELESYELHHILND